ncbi:SIMPL domain-containing protein [Anaerosinus sp.]|uniref:SIMPL domain-containing protein n=1 Tax=Selenobaculum sp. TaxID=3074374 RepID=UPI0015AB02C6
MKFHKILLIVSILCMFHVITYANENNSLTINTITVEGNSEMSIAPNQATIQIGITTSANDAGEAETKNNQIANQIQKALEYIGTNKKEIKTTQYNFYPIYNNQENNHHEIIAYTVSNTLSITSSDLSKVGTIIDVGVKNGATNINSINFTVKDNDNIKNTALVAAIENAKAKADIIAKTINKKIVNVVAVKENSVYFQPSTISRYALMKNESSDSTAPSINPDNIKVNANVEIIFEIQ